MIRLENAGYSRGGVQRLTVLGLSLLILSLAACGGSGPPQRREPDKNAQQLPIATGRPGGVYFDYGAGLAKQISENLGGYVATAETSSGSVENLRRLASGKSALAFVLADPAADAARGRGEFKGKPVPIRALGSLYDNYVQVVTTRDSGIRNIEELKGKNVSTGASGSGTETVALRILKAAGLDPDTGVRRQALGLGESASALKAGTLNAFFVSGGLPERELTDLAGGKGIVLVPTGQHLPTLNQEHDGIYRQAVIPRGTYPGVRTDIPTVAVPNLLVVPESMTDDLAYRITKLLFDKKEALVQAHSEAANLDSTRAREVTPLQLHPGAQRYYNESTGG